MINPSTLEPTYTEGFKTDLQDRKPLLDTIDRRLIERPSFSFRLQLILGFLLLFFLSVTIIIGSMIAIKRIQNKLHFVQASERFLFEVEQARRWEKNYFLYGTNLIDAAQSASNAKILLSQNLKSYQKISPEQAAQIVYNLDKYRELLGELVVLEKRKGDAPARKQPIESALRKHGAEMVEVAVSLELKEQDSINALLNLFHQIPIYALVAYLLIIIYVAYFLAHRFMKRLNFLIDSTRRIASGDFSPIVPIRKYRDEFTTVSMAFNRMLEEIDARHTAMVESHKLKAIGNLTAGVAHELNNPINNIMLTAHSLLEDYKELSEEELLEMINDLINEADRSCSIVRNLLDFARESESVSEPLDLGVLVRETIKLAENQIKVSGAKIDIAVQPNLPNIRGDKQKLKQVFLNLILNAVDAICKDGKIKIDVENATSPGFLAVHVLDNGCGIPSHIMPYIFDPFFTGKEVGKGTGLGLSVSHGIVNMHGGKINVTSEEGKYTRFTVLLPSTDIPADIKRH
ncbi:MAG: HAMP domain-containing protein [Deltaproteobacteria bacterium]|nr:MAG: HAMP domain-containing protein [Deltaproteobacteria bacterium]